MHCGIPALNSEKNNIRALYHFFMKHRQVIYRYKNLAIFLERNVMNVPNIQQGYIFRTIPNIYKIYHENRAKLYMFVLSDN